jgi:ABC-type multidrug transport system ATPase subunit
VRSGGKYGSPQYQVRLFAKPDAKVQDILSEGEKTCVALAAFLTELATAAHKSTLVFDDPVSSLDHRWRKQVATRLVEEAGERQIIVFTHDLVFVNDLYDLGLGKKRPMRLFTVSRGQSGTGVVTDGMPWKAQRVEERIDNLEKDARAAKTLYDNNQQDDYNREAASLYNGLRASWERALEDVAFFRVVQRHRDYIDTKHLKKASVLTEADCDAFHAGFKKCSDVVDAHDPSSGRNADAPPPNELMQDIQALKDWVASLRDRQKKIA